MADITVVMPQLGETVTEGVVGTWLKKPGDKVEKYESLVEVITDKVTAEVPAPVSGTLKEILVQEGETVKVNTSIATMTSDVAAPAAVGAGESAAAGTSAEIPPDAADSSPSKSLSGKAGYESTAPMADLERGNGKSDGKAAAAEASAMLDEKEVNRRYAPAVRRIAQEHNIDLHSAQITGTGGNGRVTKEDILAYVAAQPGGVGAAAPPPKPAEPPKPAVPLAAQPAEQGIAFPMGGSIAPTAPQPTMQAAPTQPMLAAGASETPVPLTPMRKVIAEHMVRSVQTSPHAWTLVEIDMTNIWKYRAAHKEEFKQREGIELTFFPFFCKAVVEALHQHPYLNATWRDEQVVLLNQINIGVAVDIPDGLIVPVIKGADGLSIAGIARSVIDLASRARANKLKLDDIQGGTITVNNPGAFGSIMSMPIINQPQAAIITMEQIVPRAMVIDDMIGIRYMMYSCLSFDHRILDGGAAGRFLQSVKKWLEGYSDASNNLY
jgi:2-oxoisovalerate dehydrogenase E2 component (dihydrolipoyl transacylase)